MPSRRTEKRLPGHFVKSWDTRVEVSRSKEQVEEMLRRYGATGFTVSEDYESRTVVVVFFLRPQPNVDPMEIRFPISYQQVLDRLRRSPNFRSAVDRKAIAKREEWSREQAERVAWRHLYTWADAALSAVDAGLYSLPEAFFAHAMIDAPGGHRVRAVDAVTAMKLLPKVVDQ